MRTHNSVRQQLRQNQTATKVETRAATQRKTQRKIHATADRKIRQATFWGTVLCGNVGCLQMSTGRFPIVRKVVATRGHGSRHRNRKLRGVLRILVGDSERLGFLIGQLRMPNSAIRNRILRAVERSPGDIPHRVTIRLLGVSLARYHAWRRAENRCDLDDRPGCPKPCRISCHQSRFRRSEKSTRSSAWLE